MGGVGPLRAGFPLASSLLSVSPNTTMSIITLETLILGALAAAPPDANPFLIIENAVYQSQKGSYPQSYRYQLYFLSGALGL